MLRRKQLHTLEAYMDGARSGCLELRPPLDEEPYNIGAQALRLMPHNDWLNPRERLTEDKQATKYKIAVDSDRHLNGRANCLFDALQEAGVKVKLGESIRHH